MKLFGTDGVRGEANVVLTAELAYQLGRAAAFVLKRDSLPDKEAAMVIGKDTRISGDMLEASLIAGICSTGVHVYQAGVIPTPGVAVLTRMLNCMAGVVISASHNPYQDNGIKFFSPLGTKLPDSMEAAIEAVIADGLKDVPSPSGAEIGRVIVYPEGIERYSDFLQRKVDGDFSGLRVVTDCANGAASFIAPRLLRSLGADVTAVSCTPDGVNINQNCGSTHLEQLQEAVVKHRADVGVAYDGDADRLLAVDQYGRVVDGDRLLLIFGSYLNQQGLLAENTVVITVMSNMGLKIALKEKGIKTLETKVGDRYVIEGMKESGAVLGGEQSGHIVFGLDNTTGDGILSSLKLLQILKQSRKTLAQLADEMEQYPQILINVRVKDKHGWEEKAEIKRAIEAAQTELGDAGRILVRASGTENLLRVMVEGKQQEQIERLANQIADVVKVVMG
ncbi:MAG: phosphoglucosamine mutase [Peptococcaceae bacterium]|nr:phosphoglucosamine mutase [Peptococcaceae bacterium]